jgi:hypothetical protein
MMIFTDGETGSPFSNELRSDVTTALANYFYHCDAESEARLVAVTNRVCAEARLLDVPRASMLLALNAFYAGTSPFAAGAFTNRDAFNLSISGCIEAYFGARAVTGPRPVAQALPGPFAA